MKLYKYLIDNIQYIDTLFPDCEVIINRYNYADNVFVSIKIDDSTSIKIEYCPNFYDNSIYEYRVCYIDNNICINVTNDGVESRPDINDISKDKLNKLKQKIINKLER